MPCTTGSPNYIRCNSLMWMGLKSCEISANLIWSSSENIINISIIELLESISFISAKLSTSSRENLMLNLFKLSNYIYVIESHSAKSSIFENSLNSKLFKSSISRHDNNFFY